MSEEIKQACHELTKSWEAIGGGASGQYHGNDYQQGLRTAYNRCAYELKEMLAGVRKPTTSKTPNESTLASATCYALCRATDLWNSKPSPPRPIQFATVIHADTADDAIAELEDMISRLRTGEYTEGRGAGRHVTFVWSAHNEKS